MFFENNTSRWVPKLLPSIKPTLHHSSKNVSNPFRFILCFNQAQCQSWPIGVTPFVGADGVIFLADGVADVDRENKCSQFRVTAKYNSSKFVWLPALKCGFTQPSPLMINSTSSLHFFMFSSQYANLFNLSLSIISTCSSEIFWLVSAEVAQDDEELQL